MEWVRQRPGETTVTGPFRSLRISRDQLSFMTDKAGALRVQNIGRCPLHHNNRPCEEALLRVGDLLELRDQALLLCSHRTPPAAADFLLPMPTFGAPDSLGITGEGPATWALRLQLQRAAFSSSHVLLCGQSGAGQEQAAQAIHRLSPRGKRPLLARNVATLSRGMLDAALFGNARNYPHAGMREQIGLIGEASGATLFLDGFAQIAAPLQERLLRAVEERQYLRLGESAPRPADTRLIAAVRPACLLPASVSARLSHRIDLPDLNQRREDIPHLTRAILQQISHDDPYLRQRCFVGGDPEGAPFMSIRLMACLAQRRWTTHLRELEGILWRCVNESRGAALDLYEGLEQLPSLPPTEGAAGAEAKPSLPPDAPLRSRRTRGAARGR